MTHIVFKMTSSPYKRKNVSIEVKNEIIPLESQGLTVMICAKSLVFLNLQFQQL